MDVQAIKNWASGFIETSIEKLNNLTPDEKKIIAVALAALSLLVVCVVIVKRIRAKKIALNPVPNVPSNPSGSSGSSGTRRTPSTDGDAATQLNPPSDEPEQAAEAARKLAAATDAARDRLLNPEPDHDEDDDENDNPSDERTRVSLSPNDNHSRIIRNPTPKSKTSKKSREGEPVFEGIRHDDGALKRGALTLEGDKVFRLNGTFRIKDGFVAGTGRIEYPNGFVFDGTCDGMLIKSGTLTRALSHEGGVDSYIAPFAIYIPVTDVDTLKYVFEAGSAFYLGTLSGQGAIKIIFEQDNRPAGEITYEGEILHGLACRRGTMVVNDPPNKITSQGTFANNELSGENCTQRFENGFSNITRTGTFRHGRLNGAGKVTCGNAIKEGNFEDNELITGKCVLENGTILETREGGVFVPRSGNKLKGPGRITKPDGTIIERDFDPNEEQVAASAGEQVRPASTPAGRADQPNRTESQPHRPEDSTANLANQPANTNPPANPTFNPAPGAASIGGPDTPPPAPPTGENVLPEGATFDGIETEQGHLGVVKLPTGTVRRGQYVAGQQVGWGRHKTREGVECLGFFEEGSLKRGAKVLTDAEGKYTQFLLGEWDGIRFNKETGFTIIPDSVNHHSSLSIQLPESFTAQPQRMGEANGWGQLVYENEYFSVGRFENDKLVEGIIMIPNNDEEAESPYTIYIGHFAGSTFNGIRIEGSPAEVD